jgi:hypothetical protein
MVFWSIYEQSTPRWRNDWVQRAIEWNTPLGNNFNNLIILEDTPIGVPDRTKWFSRYRDRFRDQLSLKDPRSFPRRGPLPASASRILEIMFGQATGPYLVQDLCQCCGDPSQNEREICFIATSGGRSNKAPIWLHTVWEEFIHHSKTSVTRSVATCSHCQGQKKVQGLRMPDDVPWIWFERDQYSPVWPSLTLTFGSSTQQSSYSLRAIIYAGWNHFTVRFRDQSGRWWRHDGRLASGVPQPDSIESEAGLLMNGTRFACTLIYRRNDH